MGRTDVDDAQDGPQLPRTTSFQVAMPTAAKKHVPMWCWFVLTASICAVSSAGAAFQKMGDVPPVVLASWRLQLTTLFLSVGAVGQWLAMPAADKQRTKGDALWLIGSGTALAVHFATWVYSLQHTSLAHSLLLVCCAPVILVGWSLLRCQPLSIGEVLGTLLALAGGGVLAAGSATGKEQQVTVIGDASAFASAIAVVIYLLVGKKLRSYQPIFVYAAPVTGWAAASLSICGYLFEGRALIGADRHGTFGWIASTRYAPWVLYLAVGPGIVGHTGLNTVLKYLSSLTVALAVQLEPVLGPCIGYVLGVMAPPGVYTYAGGALVLVATVWVSFASAKREAAEEREKQGYHAVSTTEGRDVLGSMGSGLKGTPASLPTVNNREERGYSKTAGREFADGEERSELNQGENGAEPAGDGPEKRWEREDEERNGDMGCRESEMDADLEVYAASDRVRHQ